MKYIFIFILFFPLAGLAQDCKLDKETDPFTREVKLSTGFIALDGASLTIDADSGEIDFFFTLDGTEKCFDNNSNAAVFMVGSKSKLTYRNGGTMNCEGFFHFIFKNTAGNNSMMQKLMTQKIEKIIFTTTGKKDITVTLSPESQELVTRLATCLVNDAKALIK